MANVKVRDLATTQNITNDNKLMILTDEDSNQVKNITVENFIDNINSSDTDNGITIGTDGKLYVDNTDTGVTAGTYAFPQNLEVDSKGRITGIVNGTPASVPIATSSSVGVVKPDNDTIIVDGNGTIACKQNNGYQLFDIVMKDHVLSYAETLGLAQLGTYVYKEAIAGTRYGYPDFYADVVAEYQDLNNTTDTVDSVTVTINANGHKFYDIADKATFDNMYAITGEAWYYGVDTTNERIFLPRSTRFKNGTSADVGGYQAAGLPPITGKVTNVRSQNGGPHVYTGAFFDPGGRGERDQANGGSEPNQIGFDASLSNPIYGASSTVEYSSTKLIPYMVVGNVANESAVTDVVDVTTTENDTLPLFTGIYFDYAPNNVSWVIAGGQVVSGTIYTFAYNELVSELTTPKYNLNVIDVDDMVVGTDYSTYWKVDQTNQTFTCPTRLSYGALTGGIKGNGLCVGLTDGTNNAGLGTSTSVNFGFLASYQALYGQNEGTITADNSTLQHGTGITTDDTKSGIVATESTTAKLYFKVANAVQNLELLDAGAVLTAVNNVSAKVDNTVHIIETYENGMDAYTVWSNGYCIQSGGFTASSSWTTNNITFLKRFKNENYSIFTTPQVSTKDYDPGVNNKAATGFTSYVLNVDGMASWSAFGYLAEGQY